MCKHREEKIGLVFKTNRLNTVIQSLSLAEIRLIQVGIIDSRDKNKGLSLISIYISNLQAMQKLLV